MDAPAMPRSFLRNALLAFGVTLALYALGFWGSERYRARRGPWEVTFSSGTGGVAVLRIDQPHLGIRGVELRFPGAGIEGVEGRDPVRFDSPRALDQVPFGRVVFLDTTVLPGTVTFEVFGHEVELLPRVLLLDKQEHPWAATRVVDLPAREASEEPD
ncbi:MAG: hypothetical protein H7A45_21080 [Verrucomicrobiales bacterium]|nr:hypothetical protein [Verrucomicrobiales bacterium]